MIQKIYYYFYLKFFAVFVFLKFFPQVILKVLWITIMGLFYRAWRMSPNNKNIIKERVSERFEVEKYTIPVND